MRLYNQSQSINRKNRSPLREEKVDTVLFNRPKRAMRRESGKYYKQMHRGEFSFSLSR